MTVDLRLRRGPRQQFVPVPRPGAFTARGRLAAGAIILALMLLLGGNPGLAEEPKPQAITEQKPRKVLEIATRNGVQVFSVEVADNDEDRARGLMFRRDLPERYGMLFDFGRDENVSMWMRNTYIPLDMIFIEANGRILRIAENTEPFSESIIAAGGPVRAVLEVAGGTAQKLGIGPGDRVGFPIFNGR